jgi:hypothetical protein
LENTSYTVDCRDRRLKVYGSPWTPQCGNFAFQYDSREDIWKDLIDDDAGIILTHGPLPGHLDVGKSCVSLPKEIWRTKPHLVIFGHIQRAREEELVNFDNTQESYGRTVMDESPWTNVLKFAWWNVRGEREPTRKFSHFVNAAILENQNSGTIIQL